MMSLMPTAMPRSGPGARGVRMIGTADKGADGLVLRPDCFQRLRDRSVCGKVAGIDAALEVGERDHEGIPVMRTQVTEGPGMGQA